MKDEKFYELIASIRSNSVSQLTIEYTAEEKRLTELYYADGDFRHTKFEELIPNPQRLYMHQIMDLARALAENTSVTHLNLSGQPMTDYHNASSLAEMLRSNSTLQTLILNNCSLGAVGLCFIAQGASNCESLHHLELADNMPDGVRSETNLYDWDRHTRYAIDIFIQGFNLKYNKTLQHLDLSRNKLPDDLDVKIAKCIEENPQSALISLVLSGNKVVGTSAGLSTMPVRAKKLKL